MVLLTKIEPAAVVFHNKNLGLSMAPPSQERKIIWKVINGQVKKHDYTWQCSLRNEDEAGDGDVLSPVY